MPTYLSGAGWLHKGYGQLVLFPMCRLILGAIEPFKPVFELS